MMKTIPGLAGLAAVALLATGYRGGCGVGHRHDPARFERTVTAHLEDALEDLDATDVQKAQIMALKDRLLKQGAALRQAGPEARRQLLAQWDASQPDRAAVHALVDARIEAMRSFAHEAADAAIELHGILTPEQRARLSKKAHRRLGDR